jgi:hypothetical protein
MITLHRRIHGGQDTEISVRVRRLRISDRPTVAVKVIKQSQSQNRKVGVKLSFMVTKKDKEGCEATWVSETNRRPGQVDWLSRGLARNEKGCKTNPK